MQQKDERNTKSFTEKESKPLHCKHYNPSSYDCGLCLLEGELDSDFVDRLDLCVDEYEY